MKDRWEDKGLLASVSLKEFLGYGKGKGTPENSTYWGNTNKLWTNFFYVFNIETATSMNRMYKNKIFPI